MGFDPISHAAGIGTGQQQGRIEGEIAADNARTRARIAESDAEGARNNATALAMAFAKQRNEIAYRWIPYSVRLKASIMANRIERQTLIDELRRLDPDNAENIIRQADKNSDIEYDRIAKSPDELEKITRIVQEESEAERFVPKAEQKPAEKSEQVKALDAFNSLPTDEQRRRIAKAREDLSMGFISQLPDWAL
jgi:hypothetical protein